MGNLENWAQHVVEWNKREGLLDGHEDQIIDDLILAA
jgi:hypothetical protein